MQLAKDVDQEVLSQYIGGTITIENAAAPRLIRGTLKSTRTTGQWIEAVMTSDEQATGTLAGQHDATWKPLSGHRAPIILRGPGRIDEHNRLVFDQHDGRRSMAIVEHP